MDPDRQTYVLYLRPVGDTDAIRALRAFLKIALRRFGLRCTGAIAVAPDHRHRTESRVPPPSRVPTRGTEITSTLKEITMDMSQFNGASFLKVADVEASGAFRATIVDIEIGKFNRPDLKLDDGSILSLNVTNNRALTRAYGANSEDWYNKEIEIGVGETEFEGKPQKSIIIKPVSVLAPEKKAPPAPRKQSRSNDMDDEIPFN